MERRLTSAIVMKILHEKVGIPTTIPDSENLSWDELGVDSIGLTEACANLERLLNVEVPQGQIMSTKNIKELVMLFNSFVL